MWLLLLWGTNMTQKFHKGDLVKVADKMPSWMSHFEAGMEAYIVGSYADQYHGGKDEEKMYTIMYQPKWLKGGKWSRTSWYKEDQLTLLKKRTLKTIEFVEAENRK